MSASTQCVNPLGIGTSGSSMISTNDFVPAGASFHASAGDGLVWPASQVNFDGMLPPSVKAGLLMLNAAAARRTPSIDSPFRVARLKGSRSSGNDQRQTTND